MSDYHPLCHRCEHRIKWYETKGAHQPRCECAGPMFNDKAELKMPTAVVGCYMYKPVAPVVMRRDDGDDRPLFGPAMIAARAHGKCVADGYYDAVDTDEGTVAYWIPRTKAGE